MLLRSYQLNENKKQKVKFHKFLHSQYQLYLYSKNASSNLVENILRNYSKVQKYLILEIKMNGRWGRWKLGFKRLCHFFPSHPPTTYNLKGKRVVFFLNMSLIKNSGIYSIITYCKKIIIYYFLEKCEHFVAYQTKN